MLIQGPNKRKRVSSDETPKALKNLTVMCLLARPGLNIHFQSVLWHPSLGHPILLVIDGWRHKRKVGFQDGI
jgi:hypothetical protein